MATNHHKKKGGGRAEKVGKTGIENATQKWEQTDYPESERAKKWESARSVSLGSNKFCRFTRAMCGYSLLSYTRNQQQQHCRRRALSTLSHQHTSTHQQKKAEKRNSWLSPLMMNLFRWWRQIERAKAKKECGILNSNKDVKIFAFVSVEVCSAASSFAYLEDWGKCKRHKKNWPLRKLFINQSPAQLSKQASKTATEAAAAAECACCVLLGKDETAAKTMQKAMRKTGQLIVNIRSRSTKPTSSKTIKEEGKEKRKTGQEDWFALSPPVLPLSLKHFQGWLEHQRTFRSSCELGANTFLFFFFSKRVISANRQIEREREKKRDK